MLTKEKAGTLPTPRMLDPVRWMFVVGMDFMPCGVYSVYNGCVFIGL